MAAILEVDAAHVAPDQLNALHEFASELGASELRDLLLGLTENVAKGTDVALLGADSELTPNQVSARLKMSRTHLCTLLDKGVLPSHRVGRDRRIMLADVIAFERKRQHDRRELAEQFAHADAQRNAAIDELIDEL